MNDSPSAASDDPKSLVADDAELQEFHAETWEEFVAQVTEVKRQNSKTISDSGLIFTYCRRYV